MLYLGILYLCACSVALVRSEGDEMFRLLHSREFATSFIYRDIASRETLKNGFKPILLNGSCILLLLSDSDLDELHQRYLSDIDSMAMLQGSAKFDMTQILAVQSNARLQLLPHVEFKLETIPLDKYDLLAIKESLSRHISQITVQFSDDLLGVASFEGISPVRTLVAVSVPTEEALAAIVMISQRREVLWIEERPRYTLFNRWASEICTANEDIEQYEASLHLGNISGEGMIIGISDTGIDANSCFFLDADVAVPYNALNKEHRKIVYYGTFGDSKDGDSGHGTHVSGSAAGNTQIPGFERYSGVAKNAKIAFYDIEREGSPYLAVPSNLINLFSPMYAAGARVFSNSWGMQAKGGYANSYTLDSRAVDSFMWDNPDALVLFAAGNNGDFGHHSVSAPSTNKNGMSIGASLNDRESFKAYHGSPIDRSFSKSGVAYFSSNGPTKDNRLKPDVLAPGWGIASAAAGTPCELGLMFGTSMATPLAAGTAALVRQYFVDGYYPSGYRCANDSFTPSGALLKAVLIHSGRAQRSVVHSGGDEIPLPSYPSVEQGYGRITIGDVLNFGPSEGEYLSLFVRGGATPSDKYYVSFTDINEEHVYVFKTNGAPSQHPIRITVAYTDLPGYPGQDELVINKLSMALMNVETGELISPSHGAFSFNNVMVIDIQSVLPNTTYLLRISALRLITEQAYALVATSAIVPLKKAAAPRVNASAKSYLHQNRIPAIIRLVIGIVLIMIVLVSGARKYFLLIDYKVQLIEEEHRVMTSSGAVLAGGGALPMLPADHMESGNHAGPDATDSAVRDQT